MVKLGRVWGAERILGRRRAESEKSPEDVGEEEDGHAMLKEGIVTWQRVAKKYGLI